MQSLFGKHSETLYFCLLTLASLVTLWGNFPITICCIVLSVFWVFNGNFANGFKTLCQRKTSLFYLCICALILIRIIVQLPQQEAVSTLASKIPLLIYILFIGTQPELSPKKFHTLMLFFLGGVVVNTIFCFGYYLINLTDTLNYRKIGYFMSHIRLALFAIVACSVNVYYLIYNRTFSSKKTDIFLCISGIWLLFFILFSKILIAYLVMAIMLVFLGFSLAKKYNLPQIKLAITSVVCICLCGFSAFLYSEARYFIHIDNVDFTQLDAKTSRGNNYLPASNDFQIENGHIVNMYICPKELDSCWYAKTGMSVYDKDTLGYRYIYTLCRYMASKDLRKDADGFAQLTADDIKNVQNRFSNYRFDSNLSIRKRIYEAFWEIYEYVNGKSPDGHSVTQRIEFQKCAIRTIQKFPWFGTGCFAKKEMFQIYENEHFPLSKENWNLPHNQFLLMAVTTGIVGLIIFLICMFAIVFYSQNKWNPITSTWLIAMLVSFFSEDTMNTHAGLVFCALLGSIILFAQPKKNSDDITQ